MELEIKLSPDAEEAMTRCLERKTAATAFAARRRSSSPTPTERDARLAQRLKDAAWQDQVRKWQRIDALSPASRAKLDQWSRDRAECSAADEDIKELDANTKRQIALRDAAQTEWLAFNGAATAEQVNDFNRKYADLYIPFERKLDPVSIIPFPSQPAAPQSSALQLTFFDECKNRAPKEWLIKGVIAKAESSSWYGAPGSMKSALLTDLAVHVAAARDWRNFKHKERCGVVYFAFERADLVRRRLTAYALRDHYTNLPIAIADSIIDMVNPTCVDIVTCTIRSAETRFGIPVGLIIMDTWSKGIAAGGGDEDKAKEQNFVAANLKRIHEQVRVHIAGIGHSGKDESRGERGSNARQGDVDLQVQITGDIVKTATVVKANDQADGVMTTFAMETITLSSDEDGDPIATGILSRAPVAAVPTPASRLSDRQVLALDALRRAIQACGEKGRVAVDEWRDEMFRSGVLNRDAKNPRQEFKRLRDALARMKRIDEQNGMVRLGHSIAGQSPLASIPPVPGQ
jgi:hypothetical protein